MNDTITHDHLTDTQQKVIGLLLSGNNQRNAASEAGITEETVSRWKSGDTAFIAVLTNARREIWDSQAQRLRNLSGLAIDTLEGLLESDVEVIRLRAAQTVLKAVALADVPQPDDVTTQQDLQSTITKAQAKREMEEHYASLGV
jgi:hypothetical protein